MIQQIVEDPKVAGTVGLATTSTGVGEWFGWIPNDIGLLASAIGAVLSCVLIVVHTHKHILLIHSRKLENEKRALELEELKRNMKGD